MLKSRRPSKSTDIQYEYKSFDSDQLDKILKAVDPDNQNRIWTSDYLTYRNELIIYLFLYLGCRKGELLNLKITDITHSKGGNRILLLSVILMMEVILGYINLWLKLEVDQLQSIKI